MRWVLSMAASICGQRKAGLEAPLAAHMSATPTQKEAVRHHPRHPSSGHFSFSPSLVDEIGWDL